MMYVMVRLAVVVVVAASALLLWFAPGAAWLRFSGRHF